MSNCDDGGQAFVNGVRIGRVGFGDASGPLNITRYLKPGGNEIKFEALNDRGTITYTFDVLENGSKIFHESCGSHHVEGCEKNRDYPVPVGLTLTFNLVLPKA